MSVLLRNYVILRHIMSLNIREHLSGVILYISLMQIGILDLDLT